VVTGHTFDLELHIQTNIAGSQGAQPTKMKFFPSLRLPLGAHWHRRRPSWIPSVGRPIIQSDRFNDWAGYLNPAGISTAGVEHRGRSIHLSPQKLQTQRQFNGSQVASSCRHSTCSARNKKPAPNGLTDSRTSDMMDTPHTTWPVAAAQLTD
jgi:hypothetical protein